MTFLDFDGLDGSLVVSTWSHTPAQNDVLPENLATGEETATPGFTEPVESAAVEDISLNYTEPLKNSDDDLSTAHTEPVVVASDDIESANQASVEHVDRAAGTQALQATSARLAAIRLKELEADDRASASTIPSLSDQVAPNSLTSNDKITTAQAQPGRRRALVVPIMTFLAGITIGVGILYFLLNGGPWLPESHLNVVESEFQPKHDTEVVASPSANEGLLTQESASIAESTPVDDRPLNMPGLSGKQGEHGGSSLNTTDNRPINFEATAQSPTSFDNDLKSPEEIIALDQQYADSPPVTFDESSNSKSIIPETSEDAVFQNASISQDTQSKSWTIPFTFNKLEIDPRIINELFPELEQCEGILNIVGHTCTLGDAKTNYYVGLARADYVREQLFNKGISARQLRVNSVAGDQPIATNSTKEGRVLNRRVVINCRPE